MNVLAVIPARSGSKSVPHKNIRDFHGKPMLAYSIEHALASSYINRVIVSTDSEEYAQIAKAYGAEVPFLRPAEYADDFSLDLEVFQHVLKELEKREGYVPDLVVQLRPTYPIRDVSDIDAMIAILSENPSVDSVRTVAPAKEVAYKMWRKNEDGEIIPILSDIPEAYNMPRQQLPPIYYQNACIDVVRANIIKNHNSMSGKKIIGYEMKKNYDIDTEEEFKAAEYAIEISERQKKVKEGKARFVFDIDGVIAKIQPQNDYAKAEPNESMISYINKLYDYGNEIILLTARGYVTRIDWTEVTKEQLSRWGVKYHELHFGKPNATYYIDDKMIAMEEISKLLEEAE